MRSLWLHGIAHRDIVKSYLGRLIGLIGPEAPVRHPAQRRRRRTVMQERMYLAARLISHGRQWILRFGRHCPGFQPLVGSIKPGCLARRRRALSDTDGVAMPALTLGLHAPKRLPAAAMDIPRTREPCLRESV